MKEKFHIRGIKKILLTWHKHADLLDRGLGFSKIRPSLLLLGMLILWFVLLGFSPLFTEVTDAGESVSSFKEEAKSAIKTLSSSLIEPPRF